jgi:hypothetical protein
MIPEPNAQDGKSEAVNAERGPVRAHLASINVTIISPLGAINVAATLSHLSVYARHV